ncbi:hypothetical protein BDB00DRAFT_829236 [Zychaea mexicana]|uniref:uncharacterized protein n=1 Tax=Zychaea mexicana TaxID=64656 RepID=UPI0022FF1865|nr:uncharacterized protein BDB00DRAFT_829236 [Zychaea mexicana]KAI9492309.1 hypothetical protein BDB00DRAFT_829236 [Zychaea mexicana]
MFRQHPVVLWWTFLALLTTTRTSIVNAQLGNVQTDVPWRAGHAAAFLDPYVILYGGSEDTSKNYNSQVEGSNSVWIWDSRNGSWYNFAHQQDMLPQVYIGATELPSSGQMIVVAGNTTQGGSAGMLQKFDINSWSWSYPSSNTESPGRAAQFAITTVNNTVYTYGGTSVDTNGYPQDNAVQNSLYTLDANSFAWTSGSNGQAITGHSTCYIQSCNCLVVFGGTSTGSGNAATANVVIYDLGTRAWNLQVTVTSSDGGPIGARRLHTANCMQDKMIVYGGGTADPFDSNVWVLDASNYPTFTWQRKEMANQDQGPSTRMGHTAVLDSTNQKIYIYGGWGGSATNDSNMYALDLQAWSWTRIPTTGFGGQINGDDGDPSDNSDIATIVGAVVGSVGGVLLLAAILFFLWRRKRKQQREKDDDNRSEKTDDVQYYNGHPHYWTNDCHSTDVNDYPRSSYDMMDGAALAAAAGGYPSRKRVSKAMTGSLSYHDSFMGVRSELGDTDRVMTGVLEELASPTDSASDHATYSNGTRSFRDSAHASKQLLIPSNELRSAQTPNEVVSQKPNEFSVPASRMASKGNGITIEHYNPQSPTSVTATVGAGAPLSSSMEVLRSIQTNNTTSAVNGDESTNDGRVVVTHATHGEDNVRKSQEDDNGESVSFQAHGPTGPIRYIPPASQQFSLATTTTASAATHGNNDGRNVPLTHHQYPSSNMSSVPVARPVTPDPEDQNNRGSVQRFQPVGGEGQENIYESVSPLEMLAALGHIDNSNNNANSNSNNSNNNNYENADEQRSAATSSEAATSTAPRATTGTPTHSSTNSTEDTNHDSSDRPRSSSSPLNNNNSNDDLTTEQQNRFNALNPLISMLPRRYQIDKSTPPIIGPMNSVLFVDKADKDDTHKNVVIKSFGRREAWERECRTLIKLKSSHVAELLEVLTIQDESRTPLPRRSNNDDHDNSNDDDYDLSTLPDEPRNDDDDKIKYATVLERLDETLGSAIRRARSEKHSWTREQTRAIASNVVECLAWCHSRDVAFCDLKPSNIMHLAGGPWKLIDFEASRTIGEECVGVITPRYCPPEVARATTYGLEGANGVVATPSVDLWALGCVIYELETKHALFASSIKDETILHFVSHPSPSTPILNNGLRWNEHKELYIPNLERKIPDSRTRQLIKMLLSRDPTKRGNASSLLEHPYFRNQ